MVESRWSSFEDGLNSSCWDSHALEMASFTIPNRYEAHIFVEDVGIANSKPSAKITLGETVVEENGDVYERTNDKVMD